MALWGGSSVRRYDVATKGYTVFVASGGPLGQAWYLTFGQTDPATLAYSEGHSDAPTGAAISGPVLTEVLDALITLGMSPAEARARLDKYLAAGEPVTSVEEILPKLFHKS